MFTEIGEAFRSDRAEVNRLSDSQWRCSLWRGLYSLWRSSMESHRLRWACSGNWAWRNAAVAFLVDPVKSLLHRRRNIPKIRGGRVPTPIPCRRTGSKILAEAGLHFGYDRAATYNFAAISQ